MEQGAQHQADLDPHAHDLSLLQGRHRRRGEARRATARLKDAKIRELTMALSEAMELIVTYQERIEKSGCSPEGHAAELATRLVSIRPALSDDIRGLASSWIQRVRRNVAAHAAQIGGGATLLVAPAAELRRMQRGPRLGQANALKNAPVTCDEFAKALPVAGTAEQFCIYEFGVDAGTQTGDCDEAAERSAAPLGAHGAADVAGAPRKDFGVAARPVSEGTTSFYKVGVDLDARCIGALVGAEGPKFAMCPRRASRDSDVPGPGEYSHEELIGERGIVFAGAPQKDSVAAARPGSDGTLASLKDTSFYKVGVDLDARCIGALVGAEGPKFAMCPGRA